jgi:hypothetical protein
MEITVNRFKSNNDATLSAVSIDGEFQCFGLEDEYREDKIAGETRIPAGRYRVGIRDVGGFHGRYGRKFNFHVGMLQVLDVPNFEYILIHIGNTDKDTAGCLLIGENCTAGDSLTVLSSTAAYKKFYVKVIESAVNGDLFINYVDSDR